MSTWDWLETVYAPKEKKPALPPGALGPLPEGAAPRQPRRTSQRNPGGRAGLAARRPPTAFPGEAIKDVKLQIKGDFDAELAALMAEFDRAIAGTGGGGDYGLSDAMATLTDVRANREAIKDVYEAYTQTTGQYGDEAVQAALSILGKATPKFEAIAAETREAVEGAFDAGEANVEDVGALIGATEGAIAGERAEVIFSEAAILEEEERLADQAESLIALQQAMFKEQAEADIARDEGQMRRQALLMDTDFKLMEDQAAEAVAAARRAAAAAAARRRALVAERNAAVAELQQERAASMKLNPHEAGTVTALDYLRRNASGFDYNRQQLIMSTLENALSEQVSANNIAKYTRDRQIRLSPDELRVVRGALTSYTTGMRHQQKIDLDTIQQSTSVRARAGY